MSEVPAADHRGISSEHALKRAIQYLKDDRAEIIEGVIETVPPSWDHEAAADALREQIRARARELGCVIGSGNLDLPGSPNWYVPDLAVVPADVAKGAAALLPSDTLLVVEVTSESNADTDRVVKRKRYAQYGAPLYLLIDRQERAVTLYSGPGRLGYTRADGPHPYGAVLHIPEPFGIALDTGAL
ncbi:Uma2 family endonuclease [Streptomyces sp. NPDC056149]|uniref:Uma2 family endonuclease n=1 Tax=unclassified Streptomyces TaxID=2593676 RepID=UPI0023816BFC|nr:Uma2 family endonuclease [Streptomyces sp. WZ-12]